MAKSWKLGVGAACVFTVVAGCGDDGGGGGYGERDEDAGAQAQTDASVNDASENDGGADAAACSGLTYATFGQRFLDTYCVSCHAGSTTGIMRLGAPEEAVFDDLAQVRAAKAKLKEQVVVLKTMPFGSNTPKPTQEERDTFGEWLDCGPN